MKAMDFFKTKFADDFEDYGEVSIPDMIEILRQKYTHNDTTRNNDHLKRQHYAKVGNFSENLTKHTLLKLCSKTESIEIELPQHLTYDNTNETDGVGGQTKTYRDVRGANRVNDTGYNDGATTLRTKYVVKAHRSESEEVFEIAHILHYCSIAILGVFVIQVSERL